MRWEFTPDEFMYLWQVTGRDRYPFPLSPVSAVRRESEYAALAAGLTRRYPAGADPDLDAALRVAADPAITLAAFGTRNGPIRAYGAVDTTVGVVLAQRPEPGGNVVVCAGTPAVVASMFCAVLGEVPKGSAAPLVGDLERMRETDEVWTGSAPKTADRMRRLLRAPRDGSGHLEARHGVRDARPLPPRYLSWFDVRGDGRYTYRQEYSDFRIDPISHGDLKRELTQLITPL
ncbi:ESX secretion-associated protein EspG [Nocardia sp. X0981]